jgi:hypothetical protein
VAVRAAKRVVTDTEEAESTEDNQPQSRGTFPLTDGNCHVTLSPARYDLAAALALTKELAYRGLYSIEATVASGTDRHESVQRIYDVLLANI